MTGKVAVVLTLSLLLTICYAADTVPDCKKLSFDDDYDSSTSSSQPSGILDSPGLGNGVLCHAENEAAYKLS